MCTVVAKLINFKINYHLKGTHKTKIEAIAIKLL